MGLSSIILSRPLRGRVGGGRHSAPTEFQEIENELYSLSAAIRAAENEQDNIRQSTHQTISGNSPPTASQDTLERIIRNCKHTLAHLEGIVNKYMIVSEQTGPQKHKLERWSHSIMKNWRKIEWTTEKGDLNTLRSQIMLHTNSLNLLINIGTSSRTALIEQSLNKKLILLEELHQWYVDNLKDTGRKGSSTTSSNSMPESEKITQIQPSNTVPDFQLTKKMATSDEIICPRASVRNEWVEAFLSDHLDSSVSMFVCNCPQSGTLSHQTNVQRYGISHLIFPIRIAGDEGSLILYQTADRATNQLVDLYIQRIHPYHLRRLEDTFFHTLSKRRREAILAQEAGNSLCYIAADTREEHLLKVMSDLRISQKSVESITFRSGRTHLIQEWIADIQILLYEVGNLGSLNYAEILISFDTNEAQKRGDVGSMVLRLRRNTVITLTEKASVDIKSIEAIGTYLDERTTTYSGLDVTIQFITKQAAKEFYENVESMRKELFVRSLQCPRSNEKVVLSLEAAKVECDSVYIDDAEITIVMNTDSNYRLIIASRNGCTIISQILVEDFFSSPSNRPNFTGSTYMVQIGETGERKVYHYKNGFRHLSLSTTHANRMLELARSSVSFGIRNTEHSTE
ncbi:hypothetical protein F4678DRAFT_471018 [Xylaria arbuscula]|nr:hypothetical protein F4678DRAFT_471018 [Xylaria arbuscula]